MKHEPRPAIHIGKQLRGPVSWWGGVSGDLQGRANGVSQVDGVSDVAQACQLCCGGEKV